MAIDPSEQARAINCTKRGVGSDGWRSTPSSTSEALPANLRGLLTHSLSDNSKRAYRADLRQFEASSRTIPCSPSSVAAYIAELAGSHAAASIQRRLAGIAKAHRAAGFDDPTKAEIVTGTMRGIKRLVGVAQREAKALQRDDLFAALSKMGHRPIDVRDKALLLIGFAGAFRRSELVGLNRGDVDYVRQGIVIRLRRSKTDQHGSGRNIAIPFGRTHWCPVQHLNDWLGQSQIKQGPLFRSINRHGHITAQRLSGEAVSIIVKRRVKAAGFDPKFYSGHSLRAGLATSAAMAGASMWKIRQQTGHASDAMLTRYIRDGDMFTENAAGVVL